MGPDVWGQSVALTGSVQRQPGQGGKGRMGHSGSAPAEAVLSDGSPFVPWGVLTVGAHGGARALGTSLSPCASPQRT